MPPELNSRPRLAPGCRLGENTSSACCSCPGTGPSPERPKPRIVERCDGKHTVQQIILDLQKIYSKAEPHKVEQDILGYLALLQKDRALDFEL